MPYLNLCQGTRYCLADMLRVGGLAAQDNAETENRIDRLDQTPGQGGGGTGLCPEQRLPRRDQWHAWPGLLACTGFIRRIIEGKRNGSRGWARTSNLAVNSRSLYH